MPHLRNMSIVSAILKWVWVPHRTRTWGDGPVVVNGANVDRNEEHAARNQEALHLRHGRQYSETMQGVQPKAHGTETVPWLPAFRG